MERACWTTWLNHSLSSPTFEFDKPLYFLSGAACIMMVVPAERAVGGRLANRECLEGIGTFRGFSMAFKCGNLAQSLEIMRSIGSVFRIGVTSSSMGVGPL